MAHTEYRQVQATSLTEILSDIGGNMGMFLGMSLITVTEITLFMSKIGWIAFSKRRRNYLYNKQKREKEREKQLEETVSGFNMFRSSKIDGVGDSFRVTQSRIRSLGKQIRDSFRHSKPKRVSAPPSYSLNDVEKAKQQTVNSEKKPKSLPISNCDVTDKAFNINGTMLRKQENSMIELQINLHDLRQRMLRGLPIIVRSRQRASTAPPTPRGVHVNPRKTCS
ncbi:hypothetical protein DICVIV_11445 [Dictyocaulus viviparus]|uniref:Amiloride-sensitive sodium channel n=1 Tax=Dictyocaulus viviparus TaxID=29172 RepID=A0A0D8XFT4_DICVI|nr:hypothetical protein DICVIV_11445 [Dictyocaulus viviparus]